MNELEKEFVLYQEALALKELGFDEPCFGYYQGGTNNLITEQIIKYQGDGNWYLAPTYSQAFRFFRDKYGLFVQPNRTIDSAGIWYYFSIETKRGDICEGSFIYEEAELACLRKLIEIVKTSK